MKNIAVLIDFSEGCKKALHQSRVIAELTGANIHALNVTSDPITEEEHMMLAAYVTEVIGTSIPLKTHLLDGRLLHALVGGLEEIKPDLVVLCTHGVQGIMQKLFGAHVLKLVQSISTTFVVVHENSDVDERGFARILFPATHSANAQLLIERVMTVAAECDSEVVFYEIDKYTGGAEGEIQKNFDLAKKAMKAKGVRFTHVKEPPANHSLGYTRQILDFAAANGIGLIAALSEVSDLGFLMMKSDKEKLLTNEQGIPILACG